MIKKLICILLTAFTWPTTLAQNAEGRVYIEQIKKQLTISKPDTDRVWLYVDLCTAYQWSNSDSLSLYSSKGLALAQQLNFQRGEVRILNSQGISISFHGNIPKALELLFRALSIAEKNKYPLETAICLNSIGACYFFLNDYSKSIDLSNRARIMDEKIQHEPRDVYWKIYIAFWCGATYSDLNKLDSAGFFLQKAYDDAFSAGYTDLYSMRPTILMFYGEVYFKKGNYEKAFECLHQSMETYNAYQDPIGTPDACTIIAGFYKELNKPDSLIYYAKKGLVVAVKSGYRIGILTNSKLLAEYYESKDTKQSLYYLKQEIAAIDSLYGAHKIQELQKTLSEEQLHQQQIEEAQIEKENRLKQWGFLAGLGVLLVIAFILFRNNIQKKKANLLLQQQKEKVESTLSELKATQAQLIQSEKMASLGELTTGIAHEIQNPLNFVNNFSEVNTELIEEMQQELKAGKIEDAIFISNDIKANEQKINHHGKRAGEIVKGMLQHSRSSSGAKEPTDINALADEYLRLSYHGLRAKDKSFNATMKTDFDETIGKINIVPQEIGRVILNLISNAFYVVDEKKKAESGKLKAEGNPYEPTVTVSTKKVDDKVLISVKDNGNGIPQKVLDKIFQPFFTTKPTGQGTGLGLSLSYDIVKAHGGEIIVETKEGAGTEFIIQLPIV